MSGESPTRLEELVEERRLQLRMKKQEVAAHASVHPSHLRKVLVGKATLTPDLAAALEHALQWPRGELKPYLGGREDEHSPPPIPEGVHIDPGDWAIMTPQERTDYVRIVTGVRRRRGQQSARGA